VQEADDRHQWPLPVRRVNSPDASIQKDHFGDQWPDNSGIPSRREAGDCALQSRTIAEGKASNSSFLVKQGANGHFRLGMYCRSRLVTVQRPAALK
jgi:hypothetical protein